MGPIQDAYVKKMITALNGYDNVVYEICNELYDPGTYPWQQHIADLITQTEATMPNKHLISQNMANGSSRHHKPRPRGFDLQLPLRHPERARAQRQPAGRDRLR